MSARSGLPAPPDGAPLLDLAARRRWLGSLEIAYALPDEGALYLPDPAAVYPCVSVYADRIVARSGFESTRERSLSTDEQAALAALWADLWTAPPNEGPTALLRWRGLVGAGDGAPLGAWLARRLG